jgi:hypothetical protein
MPALFAYLIALGLLLGTGYGALNWLAQGEPAKVAAKAKPKAKLQRSYQAPSQEVAEATPPASKSDESSASPKSSGYDHDEASASRDQQRPLQVAPGVATDGRATPPATATPAARNDIRSANAEMAPEQGRRKAEPTVPSVSADPPGNLQPSASSALAATGRISKRPHSRHADNHSERRALAVMTLRTIEFPDGRRITQLIPYGGGER